MADQCLMLEDQLHLVVSAVLGLDVDASDHVRATDGFVIDRSMAVSDTLSVGDGAVFQMTILAPDLLRVADGFYVTIAMLATAGDALVGHDRAVVGFNETPADTLVISDAANIAQSMRAKDVLHVAGIAQPLVGLDLTVGETLTAADVASMEVSLAISDGIRVADGYLLAHFFTVADTLRVSAGPVMEGHQGLLAADTLRGCDAATVALDSLVDVRDELVFEDLVILPSLGGAWTSNTDTWAASRYSGFELNSLAAIDGGLYGAGPDGLYAIDGADDAGLAIDASLITDQRSGGPEASLRRGGYLYGAMSTTGLMGARVFDNAGGQRHAHTYTFEPRRNDELGPMRVKYGKGVKSLMWQFEIFNIEGADFRTAGSLLWVIDPGSRRV